MGLFSRLSFRARFYLAVALAALVVGGAQAYWSNGLLIRCATVRWRGYHEIHPGVFVDQTANAFTTRVLLDALRHSDAVLTTYFGAPLASQTVILCADQQRYHLLTGSTKGSAQTLRVPGGDIVIASPSDRLPLLLTHERVHAEIDARLGWWTAQTRVPAWFIEGIAVVVSGDERFGMDELRQAAKRAGYLPSLDDLRSMRQFQHLAARDPILAYGTAYQEVSLWYRSAGRQGMEALLEGLKSGQRFDTLYSAVEHRGIPNVRPSSRLPKR